MPAQYMKMKAAIIKQKTKKMNHNRAIREGTVEAAKIWNSQHKGVETVGRDRR